MFDSSYKSQYIGGQKEKFVRYVGFASISDNVVCVESSDLEK